MSVEDRYENGQVMVTYLHRYDCPHPPEDWGCSERETTHAPLVYCKPEAIVQLPHQCDHWTIGDKERVLALVADLVAAVGRLEEEEAADGTPDA